MQTNVGTFERTACATAGGVLLLTGLRKGRPWWYLVAALGAELIRRGISGRCYMSDRLQRATRRAADDEKVDRMSEESFPASDAPATY